MVTNEPTKLLAVRLPEAERRRIKSLAASLGLTLQEAVRQALEAWSLQVQPATAQPPEVLQGSLASGDAEKLTRRQRRAELAGDRRSS